MNIITMHACGARYPEAFRTKLEKGTPAAETLAGFLFVDRSFFHRRDAEARRLEISNDFLCPSAPPS
jgi:hypothetical protein